MQNGNEYPVRLEVDYFEELSRISSLFRLVLIIPIAFLASLLDGQLNGIFLDRHGEWQSAGISFPLVISIATGLMIIFCHKYPRWWFDFQLEISRFFGRIFSYLFLLTDTYPSTDEEQGYHLEIDYPDVQNDLNRWLPLVKWLLAIPHYIILCILFILVFFSVCIAWFMILITGSYPRSLFDFVVGSMRWAIRVYAYSFLLVTDRYPPFSLK